MLNGTICRMRSSCQWKQLPQELGDDSTIHRTFQRWEACGLFPRIWAIIQSRCDELGGVDWEWQSADTALGKARLGGTSPIASEPNMTGWWRRGRVDLFPDTYLRRLVPAMELMAVGMLAA
jgi:hypothetical protein